MAFTVTLIFAATPIVHLQTQKQEINQGDKVLEKGKDFTPPVEISLVKSKIGVIEPGKKLSADEDWFKGLRITVRNESQKPITHISLNVRFPRPKGQENELDFVETLKYGESPIPTKDGQLLLSSAEPVPPGESRGLSLPDDEYDTLRALLRDSNYPPNVKKIKVYVTLLGFSDGTIWMAGKMYRLDMGNPGRLIPLEKKSVRRLSLARKKASRLTRGRSATRT